MNNPTDQSLPFVETYLMFDGRCEEALEFYKKSVGAEIGAVMRFKDNPDPTMCQPGAADKIMHAVFRIGGSSIMASDGQCLGTPDFKGFALSMAVANETEANRIFQALSEGGAVQMPLGKTFFSPCFGMVSDRFGVSWMIIVLP